MALARQAVVGKTQEEVATELGVTQPAVSSALKTTASKYDALRVRIVRQYTDVRLELQKVFVVTAGDDARP